MVYQYNHPEWFDGISKPALNPGDPVFLWGAGKLGNVVAYAAERVGLKILAFVDSDPIKQGRKYCGYEIISPEKLFSSYPEALVIMACAFPSVMDEVKARKPESIRVYDPHFLLLELDFSGYSGGQTIEYAKRNVTQALRNYAMYYGRGFLIERLIFVINNKCSLNCLNCDGYIPYQTIPREDSIETIAESYHRILSVCGHLEAIDLMGGEPLLHPDLAGIVRFFVDDPQCDKVTVITNGTVLPTPDLIEAMQSPKCLLRISDYKQLSHHMDQIIAICKQNNVLYEETNYTYWDSIPRIYITSESPQELDEKFRRCTTNVAYVKAGKLYQCSFLSGLGDLPRRLIPDFEKNYVNLLQASADTVLSEICEYFRHLQEHTHLDACQYCPGNHCILFGQREKVAEQAKGKLPLELLYKDGVVPEGFRKVIES